MYPDPSPSFYELCPFLSFSFGGCHRLRGLLRQMRENQNFVGVYDPPDWLLASDQLEAEEESPPFTTSWKKL